MLSRLIGIAVATSLCRVPPWRRRAPRASRHHRRAGRPDPDVNTREGTRSTPAERATERGHGEAVRSRGRQAGQLCRHSDKKPAPRASRSRSRCSCSPRPCAAPARGTMMDTSTGSMMTNGTVSGTVDAKSGRS